MNDARAPIPARSARGTGAALALLGEEGCPVCNLAEDAVARWTGYYVAEGHAEPEVHLAVRAAIGPCGSHLRRLAAARGGADVLAHASVDVAREALRQVDAAGPPAPCPACARAAWAEEHALGTILPALERPEIEGRLRDRQALCLPHLLQALPRLPRRAAARLAGLGAEALAVQDERLLLRVCGRDPDARARADLLRTAAPPRRGPPLREWLRALVQLDACPACLLEREAVRGALEWLATASALEPWEARLCAGHLGTLHALDALTARRVAAALAAEWAGALRRFAAALAAPAGRGLWTRARARREEAEALERLLGNAGCRACGVARTARARAGALLEAGLRDRELAESYTRGHGLCLRHLAGLPAAARQGPAGETLRSRLALLAWELEEAVRKRSWFARWEPVGSEPTAWRRLPALLGGAEAGLPGPRDELSLDNGP